jgi:hypothetical protein
VSLQQLLFECSRHYRDRGFPPSAILHLRWVLVVNTDSNGQILLETAYPRCDKRVEELLGHFKPCPPTTDESDVRSADAIFGFAFGYRMKQWTKGVLPTAGDQVEAYRLPGVNNAALAEQALQLYLETGLDLYLQSEIAQAIGSGARVECPSSCDDLSTSAVLSEFVSHADAKGKRIRAAVVVAHRHHYDRCRLLLDAKGIRAVRPLDLYAGYDELEAQPRVMTPEECIVNDFASMAGMVH